MTEIAAILAVFLLANLWLALLWTARGPTPADRLLMALLFGSIGVALLLMLACFGNEPALLDVALVFALLAAITGTAFAQRAWRQEWKEDERS